ncbi:MAG: hypothetical protein Kow0089_25070 [Desulfobulbaceae bacterium]
MSARIDRLRFLGRSMENSLIEVFIVSETTLRFIHVNRGAREHTGYSKEEFRAMRLPDILADVPEERIRSLAGKLGGREEGIIKLDATLVTKNREEYPVLLTVHRSSQGGFGVYVVTALDISDRVRCREEVRKTRDIIERSGSVAIAWQHDPDMTVTFVSNNIRDRFGYEPSELLTGQKKYIDLIHPDDRKRVREELATAMDPRVSLIEHDPYRLTTSSGEMRWVRASSRVNRDATGRALYFQGVLEDITELKKHEEELFKANVLLEKTFQSISDIVMLLDPEFRIIKINKAGLRLLNRPQDEIIGSFCHEFFPDSEPVCDLSKEVLTKQSFLSEEIFLPSLEKYFIVSYAPIFNDAGEVSYIVNVLRDITDRKLMEERLFLSEKLTTIAGLAAGVAHEINTPLSAILQSVQVVELSLDMEREENRAMAKETGLSPEALKRYMEKQEIDYFLDGTRNAAVNAAKIISNLLNFSRPQKGEMKPADLNELIGNAFELARADYDLKKKYDILNVRIEKDLSPHLPSISCVPMEIEQVLLNLIKNAVHAMASNPPDRPPAIAVRTFAERNHAVIVFRDNGPGIPSEILPKIFDPFFTTKEAGVGTGLGLSLSYSIIRDKHYGNITARSKPDQGAEFTIELPIEPRS